MNRKSFLMTAAMAVLLSLSLLVLNGCKKSVAEEASWSDVTGFFCNACGEKFYTSSKVYASYCPKCKKTDLAEVLGYVGEDGKVTLIPKGAESKYPNQSKTKANLKLPRENELKAWGATRRKADEVGAIR